MVPDPYNQDLCSNKAVHIYFDQAVPLVTYIDPEECLYLKEKKCLICESVCENEAIDFSQKPEKMKIKVVKGIWTLRRQAQLRRVGRIINWDFLVTWNQECKKLLEVET